MARGLSGLRAGVASMHGKAGAIAPRLEALGLKVETVEGLDTDRFGTFTGEIERAGDMLQAARAKARAALALTEAELIVASEGAFGPHPAIPLLAAGRELILVHDRRTGRDIVEQAVTLETNYERVDLASGASPEAFLQRVGFPEHAVIVRAGERLIKGVQDRGVIEAVLTEARGPVVLETDMRAHLNPTRMGEIARLAQTLADRLARPCPDCGALGFGRVRVETGLPCSACGCETPLARAEIFACGSCGFEEPRPRADARREADPGDCPACNP